MAAPYSLIRLDSTRSTQEDARLAYRGRPVLVVAGRQTRGRGRGGRSWATAPRAVAASLALAPSWPPDEWGLIPLVAGLAARTVLPQVGLKWPNDLLLGERKVGGILVEGQGGEGGTRALVVAGLGVNLWWPDPPEGVGAVLGEDPGAEEAVRVAERWAAELLERMSLGPESWGRQEYLEACVTVGRRIRWEPGGEGRVVEVDDRGGLVVETGRGRVVLTSGEVHDVRPA